MFNYFFVCSLLFQVFVYLKITICMFHAKFSTWLLLPINSIINTYVSIQIFPFFRAISVLQCKSSLWGFVRVFTLHCHVCITKHKDLVFLKMFDWSFLSLIFLFLFMLNSAFDYPVLIAVLIKHHWLISTHILLLLTSKHFHSNSATIDDKN